ncbi:hypothetical protein PWG71_10995 [Nocardiopsis sp. N85]|uniref:hypothetical protein n=1 Tax=Nocardiopsis sp. N85 TaxID=3029400 RepID=UPI00237F7BDC|nr:hypothetical protein [Nocardiopsis sp. N85]MDE3721915.1 hypothetical protein [Nocardiopsis sp. N85]
MGNDLKGRATDRPRGLEQTGRDTAHGRCAPTATVGHNDGVGARTIADDIASMAERSPARASTRWYLTRTEECALRPGGGRRTLIRPAHAGRARGGAPERRVPRVFRGPALPLVRGGTP